jgi:hypothetical protein
MMSTRSSTFEFVPPSITAAFGDLSRFEEELRDGYGVGQLASSKVPLTQHVSVDNNPKWHESFKDERTGLYLPATIAAQFIARQAAREALVKEAIKPGDESFRYVGVESLQFPADDIARFVVSDAYYTSKTEKSRAANTNAQGKVHGFIRGLGLAADVTTRESKLSKATRQEDIMFRHGHVRISDAPIIHTDSGRLGPIELVGLASTSYPTLMPLGSIVQSYSLEINNGEATTMRNDVGPMFVESSLVEVAPPNRIGIITGDTLHTASFGKYIDPYIDPTKGYAERVFAAIDAKVER